MCPFDCVRMNCSRFFLTLSGDGVSEAFGREQPITAHRKSMVQIFRKDHLLYVQCPAQRVLEFINNDYIADSHSCQFICNNANMAKDIRVIFAQHLKRLRERKRFTISQLAKRSGVSRQHIRDLELDVPQKRVTIITLEKLAKGLNVPLWEMLRFKN